MPEGEHYWAWTCPWPQPRHFDMFSDSGETYPQAWARGPQAEEPMGMRTGGEGEKGWPHHWPLQSGPMGLDDVNFDAHVRTLWHFILFPKLLLTGSFIPLSILRIVSGSEVSSNTHSIPWDSGKLSALFKVMHVISGNTIQSRSSWLWVCSISISSRCFLSSSYVGVEGKHSRLLEHYVTLFGCVWEGVEASINLQF